MQHLDEGTIHAWLDGELPPDEAESAARHVAGCAECRALVVEARGVLAGASRIVAALDAGPASVAPPARQGGSGGATTQRRHWYRFALTPVRMSIAATIIAAAGLTFTARRVAENSALREKAADKQFAPVSTPASAPAPSTVSAVADSIAGLKGLPTSAKQKTLTPSSALSSANADLSSSKPRVLPGSQVSDAAAFEARTPPRNDKAAGNPSRQVAGATASPGAEPSPPATRLDTAHAKDELAKVAADTLRKEQALERRRAFVAGNVNQLQEAVLTERDASGVTVVVLRDCYHLAVDSTSWRAILPSGFALTVGASSPAAERPAAFAAGVAGGSARGGMPAGAAPRAAQQTSTNLPAASPAVLNTVRALDSTGRVSSRAIGFWAAVGADTISVRLTAANARTVATVVFAANGTMARVFSSDRTDSVRVARTSCSR